MDLNASFHRNTDSVRVAPGRVGGSAAFWGAKWVFDITICLMLLPLLATFVVGLLVLNPFLNQGSLFFVQVRMGRNCKAFRAFKFRTMCKVGWNTRGAFDPIEMDRISPLGHFLRCSRIDELPQILNVLLGQMSLIGPRPDFFAHARTFVRLIPEYRERHCIRPGISGLAQVDVGYAASLDTTRAKVHADLYYIQNAGFVLDAKLVLRTIQTVLMRHGA